MDFVSEDMSYFGRPFSEEPNTKPSESIVKSSDTLKGEDYEYVPNFHDVITIWRRRLANAAAAKQMIQFPSLYEQSQALDSSAEIGRGASFVAYRRIIPAHAPKPYTIDMGGWTVNSTSPKQNRPEAVVYKTARITFDEKGKAPHNTHQAIRTVLTEMYVLSHKPILKHPNIVQFLGLAWATDSLNPNMRVPAIVVEYARHGSLAQALASNLFDYKLLFKLCAGIAEGINILHKCGIVHGDLKAENVLLFPGASGTGYVPKLADFGFSFVGYASSSTVRVGGTRPWQAPETKAPVSRSMLAATDIYSLGLLIWRIMVHVDNPFTLVLEETGDDTFPETIENLKQSSEFHNQAHVSNWVGKDLLLLITKAGAKMPDAGSWINALLVSVLTTVGGNNAENQDLGQLHRNKQLTSKIGAIALQNSSWAQSFDRVMDSCLQLNPSDRSLATVLDILRAQTGMETPQSELDNDNLILYQGYEKHSLSWESLNLLSSDLQKVIAKCLHAEFKSNFSQGLINPPHAFILSALCVNCHGIQEDYDLARELITLSAVNNHQIAQAYCWRLFQALDPDKLPPFNYAGAVGRCASIGCRLALQDLYEIEPETAKDFRHKNQIYKAGIGSKFFYSSQLLHGNNIDGYLNLFDNPEELVSKLRSAKDVTKLRVNKRGDKILHITAACGKPQAIVSLLTEFSNEIHVNELNDQGETALLCACRSGHASTTKRLLELGADASISTHRNESPLHWLISFTRDETPEIFKLLLASGAEADLLTTTEISYSDFPSGLDVDHKTPGSALLWASTENREDIVGLFMSDEANLSLVTLAFGNYRSPIAQAAHMHHADCLHIMLDASKSRISIYQQLIRHVIDGANKFSMMIRHGRKWKMSLEATLLPLLSAHVAFSTGMERTLLSYAVTMQRPEVVSIMLSKGLVITEQREKARAEDPNESEYTTSVNEALRPGVVRREHVTQVFGDNFMTPLLEAIMTGQMSVYKMLIDYGADPKDVAQNPFSRDEMTWTALHVNSYSKNFCAANFVETLLSADLPVDGLTNEQGHLLGETPLAISIMNDSFDLASLLTKAGADVNALFTNCGFVRLDLPTTILGHIAVSAARNSIARLRYLLYESPSCDKVDFVVEPTSGLTVLHRAAGGPYLMFERGPDVTENRPIQWPNYDWAANREIMYELLQKWNAPEHINAKGGPKGATALMNAAYSHNVGAVELLLSKGAATSLVDNNGFDVVDHLKTLNVLPQNVPVVRARVRIAQLLENSQAIQNLQRLRDLSLNQ